MVVHVAHEDRVAAARRKVGLPLPPFDERHIVHAGLLGGPPESGEPLGIQLVAE